MDCEEGYGKREKGGKILLRVTKTSSALLCIKYRFNTLLTIKINPIMNLLNGEANTRECKLYYLNFYKIKKQGYQHKHLYFGRISKL